MNLISKIVSREVTFGSSASIYSYDSGANSIDKQMSGLKGYAVEGESVKQGKESEEMKKMSNTLTEEEKRELVRYRGKRNKKAIAEKKKGNSKLRKRMDTYRLPIPLRMKEDKARDRSLSTGSEGKDISPII